MDQRLKYYELLRRLSRVNKCVYQSIVKSLWRAKQMAV